jgi:hypothetical protein
MSDDQLRQRVEDAAPRERARLLDEAGLRELSDDELDRIAGGTMAADESSTRPGH